MENVLLGVGNSLRGDDGIGCYIADNFSFKGWKSINGSTVPENYTSIIKNEKPNMLVIVDSADMKLEPGAFRIVPKERIGKLKLTTHAMPLSVLISYLEDIVENIYFIGIQTKIIENTEEISSELRNSANKIIKLLKTKKISSVQLL